MDTMETDSDNGVTILHLPKGSVVIVLPSTIADTQRGNAPRDEVLGSDSSAGRSSEPVSRAATSSAIPLSRSDLSALRSSELTSRTQTSSVTSASASDLSARRSSELASTTATGLSTTVPGLGGGTFEGHGRVSTSQILPEMLYKNVDYDPQETAVTCGTAVCKVGTRMDSSIHHLIRTPGIREEGNECLDESFNPAGKEGGGGGQRQQQKQQQQQQHGGEGGGRAKGNGDKVFGKTVQDTRSMDVTKKRAADEHAVRSYTGRYEYTGDDFEKSFDQKRTSGFSNPDDTGSNSRNKTGKFTSNVSKQRDAHQFITSIRETGQAWPVDGKQGTGIRSPFVTTLSTGITRISVKQPRTTDPRREVGVQPTCAKSSDERSSTDNMEFLEGDSGSCTSPDFPVEAEFNELPFIAHAVDVLDESDQSLEHEEQQMHFVFHVETPDTDCSDKQESCSENLKQSLDSSVNGKGLLPFEGENPDRGTRAKSSFHKTSKSSKLSEYKIRPSQMSRGDRQDLGDITSNLSTQGKTDLSQYQAEESLNSSRSAANTIQTPVIREDWRPLDVEETSSSEWILSGQTFSRALWRNVSAEASQLNPSFSSGVRLHRASALECQHHSFSSSDEDLSRRRRPIPILSRFRSAGKVPRQENSRKQAKSSSLINSTDRDDPGYTNQTEHTLETELGQAERYLDALLALAESKRSKRKSVSDYLSAQVGHEGTAPGKQQKRHRGSMIRAEQDDRQTESASVLKSSRKTSSQKNLRREKGTGTLGKNTIEPDHSHVINVLSIQGDSKHSSSELTSSDSKRSVGLTSDGTNGSDSLATLADSTHAVFLVPNEASFVESSSSSSTVDVKGEAAFSPEQYDGQGSRSDLYTETSRSRNDHDVEETKAYPPDKRCARRVKTAIRRALLDKANSSSSSVQPTVTGSTFTDPRDSDTDKSDREQSSDSDKAKHSQRSEKARRSDWKPKPRPIRTLPEARTSVSISSGSDRLSASSHQQESDNGHKTQLSRSSSNDIFTSESEVGSLVTFPRVREKGWRKGGQVNEVAGQELKQLSATELRRRFSAEEYVPASPFATSPRRHPSNLSEGAAPLFLQQHVRSSHVRQLSIDIGEEWENVNSPAVSLPPTSPQSPPADNDDSVFFGPSTSLERRGGSLKGEWLPLKERTSVERPSGEEPARKKSHQTSAKLRLLYPNPADPRRSDLSEERQLEILSTLTAAELLRLRMAGSPLLKLLKKKPGAKDGSAEISEARGGQKKREPLISTHPTSHRPVVTVQPMPQVVSPLSSAAAAPAHVPAGTTPGSSSNTGGGPQVTVAMPSSDGGYKIDDFEALPPPKRRLLPNPFNLLNQRCHGTLQCPCCLFFCFLCCLPALFLMSRSDDEFDYGSVVKAKRYGRWSTMAYVVGAVVATGLIVASVVAAVVFLQETLLSKRGWA